MTVATCSVTNATGVMLLAICTYRQQTADPQEYNPNLQPATPRVSHERLGIASAPHRSEPTETARPFADER